MAKGKRAAALKLECAELTTGSTEDTQAVGERLGRWLRAGDVVALQGELGAGKTTLVQGIARGMGREPGAVKSPTFVLAREYAGDVAVVHVDGYRLSGAPAAAWLDMELLVSPRKITLIEWAERFDGLLPERRLVVELSHVSTNRRRLRVTPAGEWPPERIASLREALKPGEAAPPTLHGAPEQKTDDGDSRD
jgi:tRNA threonylcarbamoyladenosine biosynthesis protein TsaE